MIYILFLMAAGFNHGGVSITTVEFNTLAACKAAAKEWTRQYELSDTRKGIVFCAEKGIGGI